MHKLSEWIKKRSRGNRDNIITKTHKKSRHTSIYSDGAKLLATEGCGTICLRLEQSKAFNVDLIARNALLRISVNQEGIKLYCVYRGRFILLEQDRSAAAGLDKDPNCVYWFSFQATNRTVLYGKKKPDSRNILLHFKLPASNKSREQYWMNKIGRYRVDRPAVVYLSSIAVNPIPTFKARINLLRSKQLH